MKKFVLAFVALTFLSAVGCNQVSPESKGVWIVFNVNCPYVSAQKGEEVKNFKYHSDWKPQSEYVQECMTNAKIGGTVVVDDKGYYVVYPPAHQPDNKPQ